MLTALLQKSIIGFILLDTTHDVQAITDRILKVLIDYDLRNRVIAITLDSMPANNIVIEILKPLVNGYHDELFHYRCACHIINLIVKASFKLVQEPINKSRTSINYLNSKNSHIAS